MSWYLECRKLKTACEWKIKGKHKSKSDLMINTIKFMLVYIKFCFLHFVVVSLEDQELNSGGQYMIKLKAC